ncbi:pyridoxamine 5'-phosphate oxidase [Aspergillus bertholletiae]|uniref:Pyridoxamine 5'-phosphate oxidase n=1 Tax=Aspergillus bertholletiae TaxID=1226010 RepID=A0A5N7B942_9EURO|nr:pyridoxamine 5'-phosphate oxidase [Aspergillus bertholletiae]
MASATVPTWHPLLQTHLSQSPSSLTLATVTRNNHGQYVPRARTVQFRGFFPDPQNMHADAISALETHGIGRNPLAYESDLLTLSTDARMEKAREIMENDQVELVWWLPTIQKQWRLRGRAVIIGHPESKEEEKARRMIQPWL